jgi:mRNA-degrading endonuclease RelE of RelBE toxin-antitoxin system
MNFDVIATEPFERKLKRLAKKYKSLSADLSTLFDELSENPTLGHQLDRIVTKYE